MWLSSTADSRSLLTGCQRASLLGGFGDTPSSSMPGEGDRGLGAVQPSSTALNDDGMSSSTALAGFSGSASSSTAHKLLCLRCAVKHSRRTRLTTGCRQACFVVAYCALGFFPAPRAPNAIWTSYKQDELYHAMISHPSPRDL